MNLNQKLNSANVAKLKELAAEINVDLTDIYRKAEIIEVIENTITGVGKEGPMNWATPWGPVSREIFGAEAFVGEEVVKTIEGLPPVEEPKPVLETTKPTPVKEVKQSTSNKKMLSRTQLRNMSHEAIKRFYESQG